MRGTVFCYDDNEGVGAVDCDDGACYALRKQELAGAIPVVKGTRLEFDVSGGRATNISVLPADDPASFPPTVPHDTTNPLRYFLRGLSANYFNFSGRAGRREYWSFVLIWMAVWGVLATIGVKLVQKAGAPDVKLWMIVGGWVAVTMIPNWAMRIRRVHDVGLSGWWLFLLFIPGFGELFGLAMGLSVSEKRTNQWGPVPPGVAPLHS